MQLNPSELDALAARVQGWLDSELAENPSLVAAERDPDGGSRRWFLRVEGEDKPVSTVWFDLRQRALHAETHLLPAPLEDPGPLHEYLLRSVDRLRGVSVSIGAEDAYYLRAELPVEWIDEEHLDRLLGSLHEATERLFVPAMRLAFGERFTGGGRATR